MLFFLTVLDSFMWKGGFNWICAVSEHYVTFKGARYLETTDLAHLWASIRPFLFSTYILEFLFFDQCLTFFPWKLFPWLLIRGVGSGYGEAERV